MHESPPRQRFFTRAVLVLTAMVSLMTGCGGGEDDGNEREEEAGGSTSSTATESAEVPEFRDAFGVELGDAFAASDIALVYCAPGLPGSPRQGCELDRTVVTPLTELATAMQERIDSSSNPDDFAGVVAALGDLNGAIAALEPCDAWFNSGGVDAACGVAWSSLTDSWTSLKSAAGWP